MRIGYLIDTNAGAYDQPLPDRENAAATLDAMIEEGILAEQAGFHSIQVPDRHGRTEAYFGSPLNLLMILARETERVALGSYCLVNTLYNPMHVAEQCAIIDNISRGRLYMTWGRGFHAGYWGQFGVAEERMLGRFLENVRIIDKALESGGSNVKLIYILYLASFLLGITGLVGLVMAYLNRGGAQGWASSHYTYQIRTFWIGLLYTGVCVVLLFVVVGYFLALLALIWLIVRCAKGLKHLSRGEPHPDPTSWLFG